MENGPFPDTWSQYALAVTDLPMPPTYRRIDDEYGTLDRLVLERK